MKNPPYQIVRGIPCQAVANGANRQQGDFIEWASECFCLFNRTHHILRQSETTFPAWRPVEKKQSIKKKLIYDSINFRIPLILQRKLAKTANEVSEILSNTGNTYDASLSKKLDKVLAAIERYNK